MQAEQQLGPDWTLQKADTPGVLDLPAWLAKTLPAGGRVGMDPFLHTINGARKLSKALEGAGLKLVPVFGGNLVDGVWGDRPQAPQVRLHYICAFLSTQS